MESCLNGKPERATAITVEDLKKDLSADFSNISTLSQVRRQYDFPVHVGR